MSNLTNSIWVAKYSPKSFEETIMPESVKKKMRTFVKTKELPNLLFAGPPGTGKTTTGKVLLQEMGVEKGDILFLNASAVNSVDDVRNIIQPFAYSMSSNADLPIRVVFLDEADRMSPQAQDACKTLLEAVYGSARFFLTANYPKRIIPALHSRLQSFVLEKPDLGEIVTRALTILESEDVQIENEDDLTELIKNNSNDIRKLIQLLQQNTIVDDDGIKWLRVSITKGGGGVTFEEYIEHFKQNDVKSLRNIVFTKFTDTDCAEFWSLMTEDIATNPEDYEDIGTGIDNVIYQLNDCQRHHEFVPEKRLNVLGFTLAALDDGQ